MRWSSRSLGSELQHQIFYFTIRLVGRRGAYCLLFFVVIWYTLRPSVRDRSKPYLTKRFPGASALALLLRTWKLQWSFGKCLVDRAAAGILDGFSIDATAKDQLESWINGDSGIIFLTAHTGCWQIAPYALVEYMNKPVTILGHHEVDDVDREIYEHKGILPPYQFVTAKDGYWGPVKLVNLLRKGEILCTTGDRIIDGDKAVLETTFLGHAIKISYLPFRLASATGAMIVFVFARRTKPGCGELSILGRVRVPEGLGKAPESYRPYVQQYTSAMEKFVDDHPYQFFNFYNIWE